ncbi:hypothetical protein WDU99_14880 [Microbacterium sp. Mu-80]|uniref:Uncharacterized protein n=1 Tax=Microbacterium bandirmense TaxID=3122050 RepID=A0ABU8LE39_9MICO
MLTGLLRIPGLILVPARRNRRIEILIAEDLVEEQPGFSDQIKQLALMLGANPIVHVTTVKDRGTITAKINSNNPHELIALGSAVDENIVSTFTRRNGDRDLHRAVCTSADAALQWLLDELPRIMGVGPGLMSYPEVEALPGRPILPVAKPTRCLHHGENHYVRDGETDWWWTRDFAQHGSDEKCVFKTYVLVDGELLWNTDHDADGDVIADKHKGRVGKKIAESATSSCGFPAKHLR